MMCRPYEVCFKPEHRDDPLYPASADELADAIDEMAASDNIDRKFMYLLPTRPHTPVLFVGVSGTRGVGSLHYASDTEDLHSKGYRRARTTVFYLDFGNPRYFPPDSMIDLDALKTAVGYFYDTAGERPDNIEWQEWSDEGVEEVCWPYPDPWWA